MSNAKPGTDAHTSEHWLAECDRLRSERDDARRLVGAHELALSACRGLIYASGWPRDCPHCCGSGYVEATRFDAGPCGGCGGTGVRDRNAAPDLVEKFAAENERADTLLADANAERDRADGLAALLAEQKAANLALADRLASASAALARAAERRPSPLGELAAWAAAKPGCTARVAVGQSARFQVVLEFGDVHDGGGRVYAGEGCAAFVSLFPAARDRMVDVPDASDLVAVARAAIDKWAELEQAGGAL